VLHPVQLQILERASAAPDQRFSPGELADALDVPLPNLAYHIRALQKRQLLQKAGTKQVRGAVQHYYRVAQRVVREPSGRVLSAIDAAGPG
jgi:DNA-binding MarR family transcriptional regulator